MRLTLLAPCAWRSANRAVTRHARHRIVAWAVNCSPQVVAGAASFGLDPPLWREMLLLGGREALARRDESLGGAVDARAGGNGREQCGGSVHWSPGEWIGEKVEWRRVYHRFRPLAQKTDYTKTLGRPHRSPKTSCRDPRAAMRLSAPASIQTDSRASLAPRFIQTRQTR